jgi:antitoxin component YwqK of YwqJK toxin-antitoxin module
MVERMENLVKRDGRWFKKFTEIPFTGQIIEHHDNGQLKEKGNYRNGEKEGAWSFHHDNGQLREKGNYRNGEKEGAWSFYHDNGQLREKGNYRNSELEGEWITYYYNGQLRKKGKWKTRKEEGKWVGFNEDGTVNESMTGTFIYGKNISNFWNQFKGNFLK